MNKDQIMDALYREDIMRNAHQELTNSLVGYTRELYGYNPWKAKSASIEPPTIQPQIYRQLIGILTSYLMDKFAKDLIEKIVDIIIKYEDKPKEE